jgi:hypothetical protein
MKKFLFLLLFFSNSLFSQDLFTPLEKSNYKELTKYDDMISYLKSVDAASKYIEYKIIGTTTEGKKIPAMFVSKTQFGKDKNKKIVFVFAQQHGNEPSGKEAILFLLKEFANGKNEEILKDLDLILIPLMNPEGGEKDIRRNSLGIDLNRNHLILTSPETQALHDLFNQYMPIATMDVHEYSPYSEDWINFGYLKNFDEQIGCASNLNVLEDIRKYSKEKLLPFIKNYLKENGFSSGEYIVGGSPGGDRIRHSTVDINDGRQSLAILNTFSFILEGKMGKDSLDNMKHRAMGQLSAIKGFLKFVVQNKSTITELVFKGREILRNAAQGEKVAIRMDHFRTDKPLVIPLVSAKDNNDTVVSIKEYNPLVKSTLDVEKPFGYLIPQNDKNLKNFLNRHKIKYSKYTPAKNDIIQSYDIFRMDSLVLEEDSCGFPQVKLNSSVNQPTIILFPSTSLLQMLLYWLLNRSRCLLYLSIRITAIL